MNFTNNAEQIILFNFPTRQNIYMVIRGQNSGYLWGRVLVLDRIYMRESFGGLEIGSILIVVILIICKCLLGYT